MLQRPIDVPAVLREVVEAQGYKLPRSAKCETFEPAWAQLHARGEGVRLLLCTQPLTREVERFAVGAIMGGGADQIRHLLESFQSLVNASGWDFPQSKAFEMEGLTVLRASWAARREMRAALAQTATVPPPGAPARDEPGDAAASSEAQEISAPSSQLSSLPAFGSESSIEPAQFKEQLTRFGLAFDGGVSLLVRRILAGVAPTRSWEFPLGCVVVESRHRQAVVWALEFSEIDLLERALDLLPRILDDRIRRGSRLRAATLDLEEGQTLFPALAVMAEGNTQAARIEMMGVLRTLLISLDRCGLQSELVAS